MDNQILIDLLLIVSSLLILTIILYLAKKINNMNKELRLREYEVNISSDTSDDVMNLLEKIIEECFSEYTILNIEYQDIPYIDAELEKEIVKNVAYKVTERLSPTLISKISLVYNINNLSTLISERTYLHTINYSIQKNTMKK